MKLRKLAYGLVPLILAISTGTQAADRAGQRLVERGRYLVQIGGCNDCHTPGYMQNGGTTDVDHWLVGTSVGWHGDWGTTYPANLRLLMSTLSERQWLALARQKRRPPMPWWALRDMSDKDLKAVYHFIRHLGPKGEPVPAYVPPGHPINTPYMDLTPKNLPPPRQASTK